MHLNAFIGIGYPLWLGRGCKENLRQLKKPHRSHRKEEKTKNGTKKGGVWKPYNLEQKLIGRYKPWFSTRRQRKTPCCRKVRELAKTVERRCKKQGGVSRKTIPAVEEKVKKGKKIQGEESNVSLAGVIHCRDITAGTPGRRRKDNEKFGKRGEGKRRYIISVWIAWKKEEISRGVGGSKQKTGALGKKDCNSEKGEKNTEFIKKKNLRL